MITSALITQLRQETGDIKKTTRASYTGNGTTNLYNVGKYPIVEGSYTVYKGTSAQTENSHYSLDKDSGDLQYFAAPANGLNVRADFKFANWRDNDWNNAINNAIEDLNGRGYFRQAVRSTSAIRLSAGVRVYSGPTRCIDMYEVLQSDQNNTSGSLSTLGTNWSYQQDANKLVLGNKPTSTVWAAVSYLRRMATYSATSATLDTKDDWIPLVKKNAKAQFYLYMAGKIAKQGNATVEEGHFSFSNLRAQSRDLEENYDRDAVRYKPTRPAKGIQFAIPGGGEA